MAASRLAVRQPARPTSHRSLRLSDAAPRMYALNLVTRRDRPLPMPNNVGPHTVGRVRPGRRPQTHQGSR